MKLSHLIEDLQAKLKIYHQQGNKDPSIQLHNHGEFRLVWDLSGITIIPKREEDY